MWILKEPGGIILMILVDLLIAGITYTCTNFCILLLPFIPRAILWIYLSVAGLSLVSHLVCCLTNPGTLPRSELCTSLLDSTLLEPRMCRHCNRNKPLRTHHCSVCNRCVQLMHHHCPWINNCVAYKTQKNFILFLFYSCLGCTLTIIFMVIKAMSLGLDGAKENRTELFLSALTMIICFFFVLMVLGLLYDQVKYLKDNLGPIDELIMIKFRKRSFKTNFYEVFGKNWLLWPLPIVPQVEIAPVEVIDS